MKTNLLILVVMLTFTGEVFAHAIGVEARLHEGEVRVEAYYDDDSPAISAHVSMRGPDGQEMAAGTTDEKGECSFKVPAPGRYEVVVDAGDGHRARTKITIPGESTEQDQKISDGPSRSEFTEIPWGRVTLGLGLIALVGVVGWAACRRGSPKTEP